MQPPDPLRIYVTGELTIESGARLIPQAQIGARQARILFARLVLTQDRLLSRSELADTLWVGDPPEEWDAALSAVLSRLRATIRRVECQDFGLETDQSGYRLRMPASAWIDIRAAADAVERAEAQIRDGRMDLAWPAANIAVVIGRRGFLAGEDNPWIVRERARLQALLRRSLQGLSTVSLHNHEVELAIQHAEELVAVDPLLESSYRHLMQTQARLGNRGEALRAYARLRELLKDELGTSPSAETERIYLSILQA